MNPATFRTNLKTLLDADSTISGAGTKVYKYPPGPQALQGVNTPVIGINSVDSVDTLDATILPSDLTDSTYTITGGVAVKATSGQDEDWTTAESTAYDLIDAIRTVCINNQTLSGVATQTRLSSWSLEPTADNVFVGEWTITVRVVA